MLFTEAPSLDALCEVVNRTDAIRELSTNSARVDVTSMTGSPTLSGAMNLRRDREFRMKASLPVGFMGVDIGSNANRFWLEVPEVSSRTLYYANHQEYARQLDRAVLPVDPTWLIDAIGLVHIDPTNVVQGPVTRPDGLYEVRALMRRPDGVYQRVYMVSPGGYVVHQQVYSPNAQLIARSTASQHRLYEEGSIALPHQVQFSLLPVGGPELSMRLEIGDYAVNQLLSGDPNLFTMPQGATNAIDLTRLSATPSLSTTSTYVATPSLRLPLRR
ncbi:MAG: hypothetical protein AAGA03_06195 [Planctomycetota bacterium]